MPSDRHSPPKNLHPSKLVNKRSPGRHRRIYCDCGQPAVIVMPVIVGINPQYVVHLPLCEACLALEQASKKP